MTGLARFYDDWADDYDATQADWRAHVREHGALLAAAMAERGVLPPASVLDCTCGIGTQAIGLALGGYTVNATTISPQEVQRARAEAVSFGVDVSFDVADLLDPKPGPLTGEYDAVLSANALTHFLDDSTLRTALTTMTAATRVGGLVVITNRDYDSIAAGRPASTAPQRSARHGVRRVEFQLWDWDDAGETYVLEDLLLRDGPPDPDPGAVEPVDVGWRVRSRTTRLRAWRRADIEAAATAVGLVDIVWTQRGVQPIFTAVRAS